MAKKKMAKKKAAKKKVTFFSRAGKCSYERAPARSEEDYLAYQSEVRHLPAEVYDPHPAPIARSAKPKKGK